MSITENPKQTLFVLSQEEHINMGSETEVIGTFSSSEKREKFYECFKYNIDQTAHCNYHDSTVVVDDLNCDKLKKG